MSTQFKALCFYERVFKFLGIFEIESDSKWLKIAMNIYTIGYQIVFTYIGLVLLVLPLLESVSIKDTFQILFVSFAYLNTVIKTIIFFMNRKELQKLWTRLDDSDYIANNHNEQT